MAEYLFPNFLDDPKEYEKLESFWQISGKISFVKMKICPPKDPRNHFLENDFCLVVSSIPTKSTHRMIDALTKREGVPFSTVD